MSNPIQSIVLTPKIIKGIANQNQYAFNVNKKLKKPEIKQICEDIFNTKVISVNTSILPQKKYRPNLKRALVKFENIKPYSNLFQNLDLSNRLKTKLQLLKKLNPLSDINNQKNKKIKQASASLKAKKKNNKTWLSTNALSKKDSNYKISQNYDYNSIMNILNIPDSFIDHFIKQRRSVENNQGKDQNGSVIDFHDWIFLMKNKLNNTINHAPSSFEPLTQDESTTEISSSLFKPLTQKDKTDFALLQKTSTFLKSFRKSVSLRKTNRLFGKNNKSDLQDGEKFVKTKKKKNFLSFTYSYPLNQKLTLKLPLISSVFGGQSKNKPKQTSNRRKQKKKNIATKSPIVLYHKKKKQSLLRNKQSQIETNQPNLFLQVLSQTNINFLLPFSLPRSLPFFNSGSKLKTKPKLSLKPKKKFVRWYLRLNEKKKDKTSKQVVEFLNTIRSIQPSGWSSVPSEFFISSDQAIKTNQQRLLNKIEKKKKKKKL